MALSPYSKAYRTLRRTVAAVQEQYPLTDYPSPTNAGFYDKYKCGFWAEQGFAILSGP